MIKCPGCGAEIEFDPSLQKVKCQYCGETINIEELNNVNLDNVAGAKKDTDTYSGTSYKCNQCGATLMTFDETAVTFCSYCGSQSIIKDKVVEQINPDFIIPFSKSKDECISAYKSKINKFLFTPNYLKADVQVEKFRGIYMPYAIYTLYKNDWISNSGEKYRGRVGDYIYYDKYDVYSEVDVSYEGVSFDLVSKFYDNYSTSIPFDYNKAQPFNINYLHGFYADTCDVNKDVYDSSAIEIISPDVRKRLRKDPTIRRYNITSPEIDFECDKKVGMFPMYFLATRDKTNEHVHYAAVNGQTGEIACDIPFDFGKYVLFSLILSAIIFVLMNAFFTITPTLVSGFALFMSVINLIFSSTQAKKISERESHTSDIGYLSKNLRPKEKTKKFKFLYKEIIAILASIIALLSRQANDMYYYGTAFAAMVLIILSFKDLVAEHNLLTSDKLPQFDERGGDK